MVPTLKGFAQRNRTAVTGAACALGGAILISVFWFESLRNPALLNPANRPAEEILVWMAYLLLWFALTVVIIRSRQSLPPSWVLAMLLATVAAETLVHLAGSGLFGTFSPGLILGLEVAGAVGAVGTVIGVPAYLRRLHLLSLRAQAGAQSEARLAVTTESSLDAIFIVHAVRGPVTTDRGEPGPIIDFEFTFINGNGEKMMGVSRGELLGRRVQRDFPTLHSPERFERLRQVVETGNAAVYEAESPVLLAGTGPAFCRVQVMKLEDGVVLTVTDLTNTRLANQELKRALAFNKAIVFSSPFSIIVTDLEGRITAVNPAAERMLLYQADELRGRSVMILHDTEEVLKRAEELSRELNTAVTPSFEVLRAKADLGVADEQEWTYLRRNGSRLPVQLTISPVEDEAGDVIGLMGMSYDLTERKDADDYIYHLAHHDTLTGLPGRSLLRDRLEVAIERGKRFQSLFAVLMIDLDHFKRVNDSLGHQAGDIVLCEIAERLKRLLRRVDTVARFGGDEFIVLISELHTREYAEHVARKIMKALALPIRVFGHDIIVTASIGVSLYPDGDSPDELIRNADIAMYRSKALGRNDIVSFTADLGRELMHRMSMETALRVALERNEFYLVYQPQVSLEDASLTGVEALIRWNNPDLGLVMPGDFIPMAEETGLIVEIGAWAVKTACREMAQLATDIGQKFMVAVNVSPRQVHQQDFHATIVAALNDSGLDPSCLEVEITERLLMLDSEESLGIIERIQALGVTTAIDDFGTGFSNMSYITRFKVDRIKIDRSFVSRCVEDENSLAVTTAIIALAHSLKMRVVAEGVETLEQAAALQRLHCDFGQGYLYARPLALAALREYAGIPQNQAAH
jgi:diguanylate cyclase (GGDEF)-like protein/PAS domain S-box-containing protein